MKERWMLNRAGIVNFWYYEDQEFEIAGGRVLFRGANGAGKSVTMQSLLPLVLDGDTRPSRLDPFGSRDRKIDYYLLGDQGQHAERTGYLWLEFAHGTSGRYLTIGIGLRARRGNSKTDFWGFALTDNRRIGKGFELYQKDFSMGQEMRIPLSWKTLRDKVGEGGHFVDERKEYAKLVNRLLFRYENLDDYAEMLHLLLELRSPKLSKDFKPTTIYGILNRALPPLEQDELYPLAEVLDSIDQIGDRQKELETHVSLVKTLDKAYGAYNRSQLFQRAEKVVDVADQLLDKDRLLLARESEIVEKEQELLSNLQRDREQAKVLREEQVEIEALQQHEAFSKEQELNSKREQKSTLEGNIEKSKRDLKYWQEQERKEQEQVQTLQRQLQEGAEKQAALLDELEGSAREMEFVYHDVFHRRTEREMEAESFWASWKRAVHDHREALDHALKCAKEHARAKKQVTEREGDLEDARVHRDHMDQQLSSLQDALDEVKEQQQSRIFAWRNELQELRVAEDELVRVLQQLAMFPNASYDEVRGVVREVYDRQLQEVHRGEAREQTVLQKLQEAEKEKRAELKSWQSQREPEPTRSLHREQTRQKYAAQQVVGVPLYAACEFLPHVQEPLRAMLESMMQETGLLDAWVGELGLQWERDDQEFWVQPQPLDFGYTLADFLRPTPPEDRCVTAEQIDRVLRSVEIGDPMPGNERVVLSEQGYFRMGTLFGKVQPKGRAEFIGKESRKQTRLEMIARLEAELSELVLEVERQEYSLHVLQMRAQQLQAEFRLFPDEPKLLAARDAVRKAMIQLETAQQEVEKKNELYKQALEREREVRERLVDLTKPWSYLKQEVRLEEAMEHLRNYQADFHELRSVCSRYAMAQKQLADSEQHLAQIAEKMQVEMEHLDEHQTALVDVLAVIVAYENALKEMKVEEKYRRLQELRASVEQRGRMRKELAKSIEALKLACEVGHLEINRLKGERADIASLQEDCLWEWRSEWNLRLVMPWREQEWPETVESQVSACRSICQALGKDFEPRRALENAVSNLYREFTEVRVPLHLYVLEMEEQNGRQLVQFNFDRGKPLTPEQMLEQLSDQLEEQNLLLNEKEKELLEKVLIQSVGVSIRQKIQRAEEWVDAMNQLLNKRNTSSALKLKLRWEPREKGSEMEIETSRLVDLLRIDYEHLTNENREELYQHFKAKIQQAKQEADSVGTLKEIIHKFLDYREWYRFRLFSKQGETNEYRELTDPRFNVMSGGEKAMAMYIPLFVAVSSRYKGTVSDAPRMISLDEAFAGVDEENVRDLFELLTEMEFDYMLTSQVLWGCFDTVPSLSIYEIVRPKGADSVDVIPYTWNGQVRTTRFEALGQHVG